MAASDPPLEFRKICAQNGLFLSDVQFRMLELFVGGLLEWNSKINLISRRDQDNIWFSHVLHSLALLFSIALPEGISLLDLGTGGGLPGIPIAIARPDIHMVLMDSIRKKTRAVEDLVERLGLAGVSVWTRRAEDARRDGSGAEMFDVVVARAVASLRDLVHWAGPYIKNKGTPHATIPEGRQPVSVSTGLIALKGGDLEKEISEMRTKEHVGSVRVIPLSFPGSVELGMGDKKAVIVTL